MFKRQNGITLIALVISIIVMLILAGVSMNAIVGEDGLLTKAQQASFANKLATYNEEFEMNAVEAISDEGVDSRDKITLMNEYVKQYVPSLEDNDIGQFAIINGQLYYVGDEDLEREVCKSQGYNTLPDGMTVEEFASSVENNAMDSIIKQLAGSKFFEIDENGVEKELGVKLSNKSISNPNWKLISEVYNNAIIATYGEGWYYVESGKEISGIGKLKNTYIINYDSEKAVKFNPNTMTMLSATSNLSVKDGLILNIDSTIFDSNISSTEILNNSEKYFGKNVELYNVDDNFVGDYTFNFDGIDDFITVKPENNVNLSSLANTGFTFEYYGKLKAGNAYHHITGQVYDYEDGGILSTYDTLNGNKIWNQYSNIRTKIDNTGKTIFSCGAPYSGISDYSSLSGEYQNNQYYSIPNYNVNDVYFIQIMFNPNIKYVDNDIEYISQIVLINGEELYNGKFAKSTWDSFIQENSGEFLWEIGRMNGADYGGLNAYANLETRAMRLYNKAITSDEAKLNYNATVAYYDYITNDSTTSTGGNTGGEDIDTIE